MAIAIDFATCMNYREENTIPMVASKFKFFCRCDCSGGHSKYTYDLNGEGIQEGRGTPQRM